MNHYMDFNENRLTRIPDSGKGGRTGGGKGKNRKGKGKGKGFGKGQRGQYGDQKGWNLKEEYLEKCLLMNPWYQFGCGDKYVIDIQLQKPAQPPVAVSVEPQENQPPPPPPLRDISFMLPKPVHSKVSIISISPRGKIRQS
eukprot:TRINITY_DN4699_c0_g1_i2.p1 TRINITY_DN4699_c0_g1~~TRINITY_DN4699_c0_g1_i2.p1  ORF type:complete len:141 (+),score=31.03 TRINITY_DN4699_c0_g1_i2:166-588(+)